MKRYRIVKYSKTKDMTHTRAARLARADHQVMYHRKGYALLVHHGANPIDNGNAGHLLWGEVLTKMHSCVYGITRARKTYPKPNRRQSA